ncbi:hypothetical protein D9M72_544910 [compost metagenome]
MAGNSSVDDDRVARVHVPGRHIAARQITVYGGGVQVRCGIECDSKLIANETMLCVVPLVVKQATRDSRLHVDELQPLRLVEIAATRVAGAGVSGNERGAICSSVHWGAAVALRWQVDPCQRGAVPVPDEGLLQVVLRIVGHLADV